MNETLWLGGTRLASAAVAASLLGLLPADAQQSFRSPDDAASSLAAALRSDAKSDILKVLGADGEDIIDSGDDVADRGARNKFLAAYDARHAVKVTGKRATLILGADDFPFPIPLVQIKDGWEFAPREGRQEILYRRIGRNELDTIQTLLAFVDAEDEYADQDRGEGVGVYAERIRSSSGKTDGLYWPSDKSESPLGELAAHAAAEGYKDSGEPQPYHGYYFRILTKQGPSAPGGAMSYIVNGKMIGGFGLLAYPAEYGNSGVMTFIAGHNGSVYQKNFGENTWARAQELTAFDPDKSWTKVDTATE